MSHDTIFALSSGRPPAAIAVVRISGPAASAVVQRLCGVVPKPRVATLAVLQRADGSPIDEAVVLWFPAPHSATGEDVCELQVHGSRAVLASIFEELAKTDAVRPAEPGEFTRRAFENGKLDLTEAEGLDDLIHADTEAQRRQAFRQLQGLLGHRAQDWRERIIAASALVEAGIDFSDEGDVPQELIAPAVREIVALREEIEQTLSASSRSERLRDGLVVAIAGPPNAGKSTLLNRLARREAAIVSPHAGTTRDVIEVHLDLDGYPVILLDTAGIRDTNDPVEEEGVRRARARAAHADLVLWLADASRDEQGPPPSFGEGTPVWRVANKSDLLAGVRASDLATHEGGRLFRISAEQGTGVAALTDAVGAFAADYFGAGEAGLVTRERQRRLLEAAVLALRQAEHLKAGPEELLAEELRIAAHALGRLMGRVDVEDILDLIFRQFCIGK
jgi:tRNA modification GTPase